MMILYWMMLTLFIGEIKFWVRKRKIEQRLHRFVYNIVSLVEDKYEWRRKVEMGIVCSTFSVVFICYKLWFNCWTYLLESEGYTLLLNLFAAFFSSSFPIDLIFINVFFLFAGCFTKQLFKEVCSILFFRMFWIWVRHLS